MESSGGIQASLGGRYATALFELARESKTIDTVEASLDAVRRALAESADFKALTISPLIGRVAAAKAIAAVAQSMKLDSTTTSFLGVLAHNRRLGQLPQILIFVYMGAVGRSALNEHGGSTVSLVMLLLGLGLTGLVVALVVRRARRLLVQRRAACTQQVWHG